MQPDLFNLGVIAIPIWAIFSIWAIWKPGRFGLLNLGNVHAGWSGDLAPSDSKIANAGNCANCHVDPARGCAAFKPRSIIGTAVDF